MSYIHRHKVKTVSGITANSCSECMRHLRHVLFKGVKIVYNILEFYIIFLYPYSEGYKWQFDKRNLLKFI